MPVHSPGSICLYHREARALFTGDALINMFGKLRGPFPPFWWDTQQARQSLSRLKELDVEALYFSHGETIREGANEKIRSPVQFLNKEG